MKSVLERAKQDMLSKLIDRRLSSDYDRCTVKQAGS